jgi:ribonuclease R
VAGQKKSGNAPGIDKARVLELLGQKPGATKRDVARILGVKGSDRIALKRILKELESEGALAGKPKRGFTKPGELPEVAVLEITGTDADGELLARPAEWESNDEPPLVVVMPAKEKIAALGAGARVLARLEKHGAFYEARIIRRLEDAAGAQRILGVLREGKDGFRVLPIDRKARAEYAVDKRDLHGAKNNELVSCEAVPGRAAGFPKVRVVEKLGSMDSPRTVSLIAIHAHGIPTEFPQATLDEALAAKPITAQGRTDLRAIPLLTIDPEDARDHDDAIWAGADPDPKNPGGHIALVAIADVAHYVTPGSALDKEALKRGNSCYFPDRVVPMLPEHLSADLCSLKEGVDRPCLAVRMIFDSHGHKRGHEFLRGVMRSAARLTYAQAQRAFDGKPDTDISAIARETLADIWAAYKSLTVARGKRDPLDLDLPERRIILGADGKVGSIAYRERLESMKLIEEFMVLANVAAAEALEQARTPLIYRVHDHPTKEKLFAFSDYLRTIGVAFAKGQVIKPGTFNRILEGARGKPNESAMNDVVLRSQAQAIYDPGNIGHFGLNLAKYAHFTSPIRRYADLIVHRALIRAFKLGDGGLTDREVGRLGDIAQTISMTERRAMAAERDSTDRYVAAFMEDRVGATFDARITGVTKFGVFVRLAESGAEGLLPARSMGAEYFRHDERAHAMIGDRTGTVYKLGDIVPVRLAEAAPLTGGLRFELADGAPAPRKFAARRPKPGPKRSHFRPKKR